MPDCVSPLLTCATQMRSKFIRRSQCWSMLQLPRPVCLQRRCCCQWRHPLPSGFSVELSQTWVTTNNRHGTAKAEVPRSDQQLQLRLVGALRSRPSVPRSSPFAAVILQVFFLIIYRTTSIRVPSTFLLVSTWMSPQKDLEIPKSRALSIVPVNHLVVDEKRDYQSLFQSITVELAVEALCFVQNFHHFQSCHHQSDCHYCPNSPGCGGCCCCGCSRSLA